MRLADYVREIVVSGFPGWPGLTGRALRAQVNGYVRRIVDRDFREQGLRLRNPGGLLRRMTAYAAATATTASLETVRDAVNGGQGEKPDRKTVQPYREILERLWILDAVPAWLPKRNHLNRLGQPPEHHLAEPALAVTLLGLVERLDGRVAAIEVKLGAEVRDDDVRNLLWLRQQIGSDLLDSGVVNTAPAAYRRPGGVAVVPSTLLGP